MTRILVAGEDSLCCVLGERMIASVLPQWQSGGASIDTHGVTRLIANLPRYANQARHVQAMLCIADTDGRCAVDLCRAWLPPNASSRFLLRLAVTEAESWVLADRQAVADFFQVAVKHVPQCPDDEPDAKRIVLRLAVLSGVRELRQEVVSARDKSKPGTGYNLHLHRFVRSAWQAQRAAERSDSLRRALARLAEMNA